MGFIVKFILISLAITWLFRAVIGYFARKVIENANNHFGSKDTDGPSVHKTQPTEKKINKDVGEYVDYEEIK